MKFNYRDFFIHNDDLSIIKEQLSIVDEAISRKNRLTTHAKAVWDMYQNESSEQNIADKLNINLSTVQKIIQICLKNTVEKKNPNTIAKELGIPAQTVKNILNKALGSERERDFDTHFVIDAVEIYNLHKDGKTPEEIVKFVNNRKQEHLAKIDLDKVNLVLDIVKIAKKQMGDVGEVNAEYISREIGGKISRNTITRLIKKLNLGKIQYQHEYTEEQDAFILYLYLQENGPTEIARQFNEKFKDPEGNALNILDGSIGSRLKKVILKPKGESEISEYVLKLLNKYTEYFSTVKIKDPNTKAKLTRYIPPETSTLKRKDYLRKYHSTRNIIGQGTAGTQYFDVGASDNIGPSRVIAKRLGGHSPTT